MGDASKEPFEADELLDQLLHQSTRSDVDADRIERLADQWQSISRRRVRVQVGLTAIGCLMISIGAMLAFRGSPLGTPIVKPEVAPERPAEYQGHEYQGHEYRGHVVQREPISPRLSEGDAVVEANISRPYDRLICVAVERKVRQRRRNQQVLMDVPPASEMRDETIDDIVATALKRLARQQKCDDLVSRIKDEWSEQELLTWIEAAPNAESIDAALQLLSQVMTSRSIPVLMRLRSTHYERCTRLVAQVAGRQLLFVLVQQETDQSLRQELAAALLRHSDPQALPLFLQLVDNRSTSATALAAVRKLETLPIPRLLQCLSDRSRKVRLTAAMVLAQSKDPQVSAQLVQLLRGSRTRRSAMVALVASDNDVARRFVDQASHNVYLAASVHAAQTVVNSFRLES